MEGYIYVPLLKDGIYEQTLVQYEKLVVVLSNPVDAELDTERSSSFITINDLDIVNHTVGYCFTSSPSHTPTSYPSHFPTLVPSPKPSGAPTLTPTRPPTLAPSAGPSGLPTLVPTLEPTSTPTTPQPSPVPTLAPTVLPTPATPYPSVLPTLGPSEVPTLSPAPTSVPTLEPTAVPSLGPTASPTAVPTLSPTPLPSPRPTPVRPLPTPVPTRLTYTTAKVSSGFVVDGLDRSSFTPKYRRVMKEVVVSTVDSIDDISAVTQLNVSAYTSRRLDLGGAGGRVAGRRLLSSSSAVTFTIEVVLENTEFDDSASIASNIESDVTSAVSSGNLTSTIQTTAAASGVTLNVTVDTTVVIETSVTTVIVERSVPSQVPTGVPTKSVPTGVPTKSPVYPTMYPTTGDTVTISVALTMTASAPATESNKATMKTTIAAQLSVEEKSIKNFAVSSATSRRLQTRQAGHRELAIYTWIITFDVSVSLAAVSMDSASQFAASVTTTMERGLLDALKEDGLPVTSVTVTVEYDDDESPSDDGDAEPAMVTFIIIGVVCGLLFGVIIIQILNNRKQRGKPIHAVTHIGKPKGPLTQKDAKAFPISRDLADNDDGGAAEESKATEDGPRHIPVLPPIVNVVGYHGKLPRVLPVSTSLDGSPLPRGCQKLPPLKEKPNLLSSSSDVTAPVGMRHKSDGISYDQKSKSVRKMTEAEQVEELRRTETENAALKLRLQKKRELLSELKTDTDEH